MGVQYFDLDYVYAVSNPHLLSLLISILLSWFRTSQKCFLHFINCSSLIVISHPTSFRNCILVILYPLPLSPSLAAHSASYVHSLRNWFFSSSPLFCPLYNTCSIWKFIYYYYCYYYNKNLKYHHYHLKMTKIKIGLL